MKSKIKKLSKEELEELYYEELERFNLVCEEMVKEFDERGGKPYENIEIPTELMNDPNFLPF